MDTELNSIGGFLAGRHPFEQLPEEVLASLAEQLEKCHFDKDRVVLAYGAPNSYLYIIHRGAVEVIDPEEGLLARLGEGDIFGHRSLLDNGLADDEFRTIEDTVLYRLPAAVFHQLCRDYPQFRYFFGPVGARRLRRALQSAGQEDSTSLNLLTTSIADLVTRTPVTRASGATIREAAETMTREGVSSLMVVDDGRLTGIVTDRDLRRRVIAKGLPYERPLSEIMTPSPATVGAGNYVYEALLTMARSGYHHLPVMQGERLIGMITSTDLVQRRSVSPLYLMGDIYKRQEVDDLVKDSRRLEQMMVALVEANASAHSIGHIVSSIGEAITCRLLELAEQRFGAPPVPYVWMVGGSMARREQTAHTDQDNFLVLSDAYSGAAHGSYFEALSRFVCDALDACGYIYCPGDIMAMNPRWRQPLTVWKGYFDKWIDQPEPKALLHSTIFFDLRGLHGDMALCKELQAHVLDKASRNQIFLAYMAANALTFQPPLGFFRNFVLIKGGEHDRTLDLKLSGVVPITDLARVYALSGGLPAVNTRDRIDAGQSQGLVNPDSAADLRDALEFISTVRLRHQARQIQKGQKPNNYMSPKELSHFERSHLKDAFSTVRTIQSAFSQRYQVGHFG